MKFLFFGDSITDAGWNRNATQIEPSSYGFGYVHCVASELLFDSNKNIVINRGVSGNRIVDLYARVKQDFWNLEPDVVTILIGINEVWHDIHNKNGVEIDRYENIYRLLLKETKERLPNIKIILMEPFVLHGSATTPWYEHFLKVVDYANVVKKIAKEFDADFVPLQEKLTEFAKIDGEEHYLYDGVHPAIAGAKLIANEWMKVYKDKISIK